MSTRIDLSTWACTKVRGRVYEVWRSPLGEVVVLGNPDSEDETHNCDAHGCGQDHVLWRSPRTREQIVRAMVAAGQFVACTKSGCLATADAPLLLDGRGLKWAFTGNEHGRDWWCPKHPPAAEVEAGK